MQIKLLLRRLAEFLLASHFLLQINGVSQPTPVAIKTEADVIANTTALPGTPTNKIVLLGPPMIQGSVALPLACLARAEIEGDKVTAVVVASFEGVSEYPLFETLHTDRGKELAIKPVYQQEVQGKKVSGYAITLLGETLEKAKKDGFEWAFRGPKLRAVVKMPAFYFTGFMKKVFTSQLALKPGAVDDSLLFSGSIGSPKTAAKLNKEPFSEVKDLIDQPLIFVPLEQLGVNEGYSLILVSPDGQKFDFQNRGSDQSLKTIFAGKEIELLSVRTNSDLRREIVFEAKLMGQTGWYATNIYDYNPFRGLVPKSEIERVRSELTGKTLWLRSDTLFTYDAGTQQIQEHRVKKLRPVTVEKIVLGTPVNPIRLILRTESGDQYFQQYTCYNGIFLNPGFAKFDHLFFTEDPRKLFGWPEDIILTIEDSKIRFGMTKSQVLLSWGNPDKRNTVSSRGTEVEQWIYGDQFIYFEGDKYIDYQKFDSH